MQIQSSNYIPVNKLSREDVIHRITENNEKMIEGRKKIIENNEKMIEGRKKIIENNEKMIEGRKKIIENNEKMIEGHKQIQDNCRKGIALIEGFFAKYLPEEDLGPAALKKATSVYVKANKLTHTAELASEQTYSTQISRLMAKEEPTSTTNDLLGKADFMLQLGKHGQAMEHYNEVLSSREDKPVDEEYVPVEEKLRQAARLYVELQPLVENLKLYQALKEDIYCTAIAAHTHGVFSVSKAEVFHMINNQFFYSEH